MIKELIRQKRSEFENFKLKKVFETLNDDFNNKINSFEHQTNKVFTEEARKLAKIKLARFLLEKTYNPLTVTALEKIIKDNNLESLSIRGNN